MHTYTNTFSHLGSQRTIALLMSTQIKHLSPANYLQLYLLQVIILFVVVSLTLSYHLYCYINISNNNSLSAASAVAAVVTSFYQEQIQQFGPDDGMIISVVFEKC